MSIMNNVTKSQKRLSLMLSYARQMFILKDWPVSHESACGLDDTFHYYHQYTGETGLRKMSISFPGYPGIELTKLADDGVFAYCNNKRGDFILHGDLIQWSGWR